MPNEDEQITDPVHYPTPYLGNAGMGPDRDNVADSIPSTVRSVCCIGGIVALALTGHCDGTYALVALAGIAVPGILTSILTLKGLRK